MNNDKTGGAAFPTVDVETMKDEDGMTLLDYFAAKAMPELIATAGHSTYKFGVNDEDVCGDVAKAAYSLAAAMLQERKKYITE